MRGGELGGLRFERGGLRRLRLLAQFHPERLHRGVTLSRGDAKRLGSLVGETRGEGVDGGDLLLLGGGGGGGEFGGLRRLRLLGGGHERGGLLRLRLGGEFSRELLHGVRAVAGGGAKRLRLIRRGGGGEFGRLCLERGGFGGGEFGRLCLERGEFGGGEFGRLCLERGGFGVGGGAFGGGERGCLVVGVSRREGLLLFLERRRLLLTEFDEHLRLVVGGADEGV